MIRNLLKYTYAKAYQNWLNEMVHFLPHMVDRNTYATYVQQFASRLNIQLLQKIVGNCLKIRHKFVLRLVVAKNFCS